MCFIHQVPQQFTRTYLVYILKYMHDTFYPFIVYSMFNVVVGQIRNKFLSVITDVGTVLSNHSLTVSLVQETRKTSILENISLQQASTTISNYVFFIHSLLGLDRIEPPADVFTVTIHSHPFKYKL